jgi:hypothetical protein
MKNEFEYKSILLTKDRLLSEGKIEELNEYYAEGWEYLDSVAQCVTNSELRFGPVMVVLRRAKTWPEN